MERKRERERERERKDGKKSERNAGFITQPINLVLVGASR